MKAIIREFYCTDFDVADYVSDDPKNDGVWIRLIVGPTDDPGEESFDVLVCTPLWLRDIVAKNGPQIGRHHLIMEPLNIDIAIDFLRLRIESIYAQDWVTLAEKIGRIGYWEFEEYNER